MSSTVKTVISVLSIVCLWTACGRGPVSVAPPAGSGVNFAAGACRRFTPTRGDQHLIVFLDPGHGGPDPGASGRSADGPPIEEKTVTLAVAMDLLPLLQDQGYTVVLARTQDSSVVRLGDGDLAGSGFSASGEHRDLLARIHCANASGAGLLLSIHFNGFDDPSVGGAETFYDAVRPFSTENEHYAEALQKDVIASLAAAGWQVPDRGIATDTSDDAPALTAQAAAYPYLLELGPAQPGWLDAPSQMPGALIEPLFLSDPIEASIAGSQAGQLALARGLDTAIQSAALFLPERGNKTAG